MLVVLADAVEQRRVRLAGVGQRRSVVAEVVGRDSLTGADRTGADHLLGLDGGQLVDGLLRLDVELQVTATGELHLALVGRHPDVEPLVLGVDHLGDDVVGGHRRGLEQHLHQLLGGEAALQDGEELREGDEHLGTLAGHLAFSLIE